MAKTLLTFHLQDPVGVGEEDVQEHHPLGDGDEVITDQPHNEMEEGHLAEEVKRLPFKTFLSNRIGILEVE